MSIKIEIYAESADDARAEMSKLLGAVLTNVVSSPEAQKIIATGFARGDDPEEVAARVVSGRPDAEEAAPSAKRERGKPAPGRARRTKEEIAEDEAAEASLAQISTNPENRVGPEDDAETEAQDKADEQAEVEAARTPEKAVTLDDVKNTFGLYIQKFGMDAVKEDGVNILADALADVTLPAGETFWKASIIPEAKYQTVIDAFTAAASASERYQRKGA